MVILWMCVTTWFNDHYIFFYVNHDIIFMILWIFYVYNFYVYDCMQKDLCALKYDNYMISTFTKLHLSLKKNIYTDRLMVFMNQLVHLFFANFYSHRVHNNLLFPLCNQLIHLVFFFFSILSHNNLLFYFNQSTCSLFCFTRSTWSHFCAFICFIFCPIKSLHPLIIKGSLGV